MTQYLILHKVRGQPSFDCATKIACSICKQRGEPCDDFNRNGRYRCDGGYWWITNAGHRAYPYKTWSLECIEPVSYDEDWYNPTVPADWPDFFDNTHEPTAKKGTGIEVDMSAIVRNLIPKVKIHRRF